MSRTAWYSASPWLELGPGGTGKFNDGFNLRRGRIFFEGTLYEAVDYKFELEFANGLGFSPVGTTGAVQFNSVTNSPGPTDAWITVKDVPLLGNVRIGSQKEWFSLEHLNNYRALEFLERSYLFDFAQATAFNNGFTPGISVFRTVLGSSPSAQRRSAKSWRSTRRTSERRTLPSSGRTRATSDVS